MWGAAVLKGLAQQAPPDNARYSFTLAECVAYAYQHQNDVKNADLDNKSTDFRLKEITGSGYPQISGSASFQDYIKIPTTLIPGEFFNAPGTFIPVKFGVKYQSNVGVNVSQIIFDGNYFVGLKARQTYKELSERSLTRSKIDVNVNVTKAYYQVLVSDKQITLLDANIKQLKQQLDETTAQNKQGFAEKIDVDRLDVQYNNLVTNRENVVRLLALNYQLLKFQMGMPIENSLTLKDKLEDIKLDDNLPQVGADTTFYRNRVEYSLLEAQKKLNEYDLQSKKAQYLPKLTANGSYALSYQNNSFSDLYSTSFPSGFIGLTLNIPIYNGGQRNNQVKQSQITVQKAQNNLDNAKNALMLEASKAKVTYINGLNTLKNQQHSQELAREVLRVSRIKYQQGVGSSIEVTQAQTALESADNTYIQGLYDALVSKVDLDKAYGRIQ